MKPLKFWIRIALSNLAIVAFLGLTLRSKMIFSIPFLDFKYILHAHSHFAFGGWVTLGLLALMTYKLLPVQLYTKPIYKWLLVGTLFNAYGMLFSFSFQGYAFFSILFSTLFTLVSYIYTATFIRDIQKTSITKSVKILAIGAVSYMALSSVGPFTLAYLMATKSQNAFLSKDAVYTYLHLQYSGFFTLAVFALMLHYLNAEDGLTRKFSFILNASVLPSMFISYLWHYPDAIIKAIAIAGSALLIISIAYFIQMLTSLKPILQNLKSTTKKLTGLAMIAFTLKMAFQALTILPDLGTLIFSNRPIIIGFLHLVLLGFISLFMLGYFIENELLLCNPILNTATWIFVGGVIFNEIVLFAQGLGFILMIGISIANWLLLVAAACLFIGALLIAFNQWLLYSSHSTTKNFRTINHFSRS